MAQIKKNMTSRAQNQIRLKKMTAWWRQRGNAPTGQCEVNHSPSASLFKTEIAPDVAEPWGG